MVFYLLESQYVNELDSSCHPLVKQAAFANLFTFNMCQLFERKMVSKELFPQWYKNQVFILGIVSAILKVHRLLICSDMILTSSRKLAIRAASPFPSCCFYFPPVQRIIRYWNLNSPLSLKFSHAYPIFFAEENKKI